MKFISFSFVAILSATATNAVAATCSTGTAKNDATFELLPDSAISAATCIGTYNNDAGANGFFAQDGVIFDVTGDMVAAGNGYTLATKSAGGGDGSISFSTDPAVGAKSGSWAIGSLNGYTNVVVVLKAGPGFGAFLLDGDPLMGTWSSSKGLSHASIWRTNETDIPEAPLPAAGLMLLAGLGGLVAAKRRRKN